MKRYRRCSERSFVCSINYTDMRVSFLFSFYLFKNDIQGSGCLVSMLRSDSINTREAFGRELLAFGRDTHIESILIVQHLAPLTVHFLATNVLYAYPQLPKLRTKICA